MKTVSSNIFLCHTICHSTKVLQLGLVFAKSSRLWVFDEGRCDASTRQMSSCDTMPTCWITSCMWQNPGFVSIFPVSLGCISPMWAIKLFSSIWAPFGWMKICHIASAQAIFKWNNPMMNTIPCRWRQGVLSSALDSCKLRSCWQVNRSPAIGITMLWTGCVNGTSVGSPIPPCLRSAPKASAFWAGVLGLTSTHRSGSCCVFTIGIASTTSGSPRSFLNLWKYVGLWLIRSDKNFQALKHLWQTSPEGWGSSGSGFISKIWSRVGFGMSWRWASVLNCDIFQSSSEQSRSSIVTWLSGKGFQKWYGLMFLENSWQLVLNV